jgi:tRNA nucleotidyltransferase/poly(A) polymerase
MARKRVCVIGDASERYIEDPVRMWRVLRYASRQGFAIEHESAKAIETHKTLLGACSGSRLYEELNKDLVSGFAAEFFQRMSAHTMLSIILGNVGRIIEESPRLTEEFLQSLRIIDESIRRASRRLWWYLMACSSGRGHAGLSGARAES